MSGLTKFGQKTPKAVIHKSESHKLHQAFEVKKDEVILNGSPVKLLPDGTVTNFTGEGTYIGIAMSDSKDSPYRQDGEPSELTVLVNGYAVIYGLSSAAVNAGPVKPTAVASDSPYLKYSNTVTGDPENFIAINKVTAADELIMILVK